MAHEIIYVCNSINNKNVRDGELEILRKYEENLYFEFGADEINIKKRIYNDVETLNKDYEALLKLKEDAKKKENASYIEEDASMPLKEEKNTQEDIDTDKERVVNYKAKMNRGRKRLI